MNITKRKLLTKLLCIFLVLPSLTFGQALTVSDVSDHWAKPQLNEWLGKGLVSGYPDGTFRPDAPIKRSEFIKMINQVFGFTEISDIHFSDVKKTDWFFKEIGKAVNAGYISGYEDNTVRPNNSITRQEVATILAKILELDTDASLEVVNKFNDANDIPDWSKKSVSAVVEKGYMRGYTDGTYRPAQSITRAESVVTLDRVIKGMTVTLDKAGVYTMNEINSSVVIAADNVTLKDTIIKGDLIIDENVGEGEAFIDGVTVEGKTIINGGGENSIHISNSKLAKVIVTKVNGIVRIVVSGNTDVGEVNLQSGAKLEEENVTGQGFSQIVLSDEMLEGAEVILLGDFEEVKVISSSANIKIERGSIKKLEVSKEAENTRIDLAKGVKVGTLELNAKTEVTGKGEIEKAEVNANGVKIEQKPKEIVLGEDVEEAEVGGEKVSGDSDNSGGSGGGGSGGDDDEEPKPSIALSWKVNYEEVETVNNVINPFEIEVTARNQGTEPIENVLFVVEIDGEGVSEVISDDGQNLGYDQDGGFWYWGPKEGATFNGKVVTTFKVYAEAGSYTVRIFAVQLNK